MSPKILFDNTKDVEAISTKLLEPSSDDLKFMASRFSKEQWEILCASSNFMDMLYNDFNRSRFLAEKILAGRGDTINAQNK